MPNPQVESSNTSSDGRDEISKIFCKTDLKKISQSRNTNTFRHNYKKINAIINSTDLGLRDTKQIVIKMVSALDSVTACFGVVS
jgi:hypothetical protein